MPIRESAPVTRRPPIAQHTTTRSGRSIVLAALIMLFGTTATGAATLSVVPVAASSGLKVTVQADAVADLAGARMVLVYDQETLAFTEARKTPATASFMHVVNPRKPGEVIVVLASAKGISGDKLPLIEAEFSLLRKKKTGEMATVRIERCELMSEKLQAIPCSPAGPAAGAK